MTDSNVNQVIELEGEIDSGNTAKSQSSSATSATNASALGGLGMFASIASIPNLNLQQLKPQEWIAKRRETLKPWGEFFNTSKFKKPSGITQAISRLIKNLEHFQSNYLFVFVGLAVYCILTSPLLLFVLFGFLGACYIAHIKNKDGKIKLLGKELSLAQLYTVAGCVSIPLFLITGAGSAVFWIIGASLFVIVVHAVCYQRDEEDPFMVQMNAV